LHFLKTILAKYTAFFLGAMKALGMWGPFTIAAVDAAAFGLPLDPVVAAYVWSDRAHFWLYPLSASLGSALGSLILYYIGRKGGEVALRKRISRERMEALRNRFEKQEFFALMIPSMAPPPFPFKLFVLSAGVFDMKVRDFLAAIFLGRMVRFTILTVLVLKFGPSIVETAKQLFREHRELTLLAIAALLLVGLLIYRLMRRPVREMVHEAAPADPRK
jgi:membrane protein YqaA with SNARE-associated domain